MAIILLVGSCSKDDGVIEPNNTVTLNMLDELNGKTMLGNSSVYINKSNNFKSTSEYISNCGETSGLDSNMPLNLNNFAKENAVLPGNMYQIFAPNTIHTFPSKNNAIEIGSFFYQVYVAGTISKENTTIGATVRFASIKAVKQDLPEVGLIIGETSGIGQMIEYQLPDGAECEFSVETEEMYSVEIIGNKLVLQQNFSLFGGAGKLGDFPLNIRQDNVYTTVMARLNYTR